MLSRIWNWFTGKWPWYPLKRLLLEEEIPGGTSFAYTLGSAIIVIFSLQVLSGVLQLFYYVPTVDHAYDSVTYIRTQVPFGWLVHNIHYWGASIMIVLVALHMVRVYIWGAYKTQLTWLIGIALVATTMTLIQTGTPLPWDQKGYWAGEVGTSIPGTIPVVGDIMKRIIRGGETMGQLALSRFFTIHVTVLVPTLVLLIGAHIASFRMSGVAGAWDEEKRKKTGRFWPDQSFKDIVTATSVVFILITLCVFFPPDFTGPADPSNTTYLPKPEWAFLFLYEALKYFKGPLEPVGAGGVPAVLIGLLVLLLFIDRSPERNPLLRPFSMICLAVYAGLLIVLTIMGYLSSGFAQMSGPQRQSASVTSSKVAVSWTAGAEAAEGIDHSAHEHDMDGTGKGREVSSGSGPEAGRAAYIIGSAGNGGILFERQCTACHGTSGKQGIMNPGSDDGTVPALNPIDRELFNTDPRIFAGDIDRFIQHGSIPEGPDPAIHMHGFGDDHSLTQGEIANIEAYILSLNGVDRAKLINPGMEPRRFFMLAAAIFGVAVLILGGIWKKKIQRYE